MFYMHGIGWGWWLVESPEAILRRRLAQGEISVEEYDRLRDAIERPPSDKLAA